MLMQRVARAQLTVGTIMSECAKAVSACSDEGERISKKEKTKIMLYLFQAKKEIEDLEKLVCVDDIIGLYNSSIKIADIEDCALCTAVERDTTINDVVHNPAFSTAVFSIKNLLETIDDKIAEQDHTGIKACLTCIANELNYFPQLREVSNALYEVRDAFVDIVMVSDMMFDFEKFYKSVFILHDELNVGIALGSIKSALPPPEVGDIEFF